ncbi:MAG: restriction endonuclease [Thermodesulfovibrio sp. RBG_19FT_COMBO_42_12]|nr:MAG: restriction endonuclease [Thermodesulfovibrio sp. RBG_19FT_COMBO_42_12]
MAASIIEKKKYTYDDYLKTPDDMRYELIEGELYMTPSPITNHQRISGRIEFELRKFVAENDCGEVFDAPYDVYFDDENVVQPDILFISKDRLNIIGDKNLQGAPDLVIEILSESNAYRDLIQKKKLYARHGVQEYWIVVPGEKNIDIHILKDKTYQLYQTLGEDEILESPILKGFKMELKAIFK